MTESSEGSFSLMSPSRPTPISPPRATERNAPHGAPVALKVLVTILSAVVLLFMANTLRSGTDDSATSLSTQSLLSLPSNEAASSASVPTTAPLQLPTTAPVAAPTATVAPTPAPTATVVPTATAIPAVPTPEPAAQASTLAAESQAQPAEPATQAAEPQAAQPQATEPDPAAPPPEPPVAVAPTEAPVVEVATPEPTATPPVAEIPVVEPTVVVEEVPTPTPEPTPTPTPEPISVYDMELYVLGDINQIRANAGLAPLILDESISVVARDWSTQMATGGFFEHRPGSQLNVMMPAGWLRWGENIASAPDIQYAQDSLVASPGHFENMVGDYTHIGIGVYTTGRQVWVTQNFGKY